MDDIPVLGTGPPFRELEPCETFAGIDKHGRSVVLLKNCLIDFKWIHATHIRPSSTVVAATARGFQVPDSRWMGQRVNFSHRGYLRMLAKQQFKESRSAEAGTADENKCCMFWFELHVNFSSIAVYRPI